MSHLGQLKFRATNHEKVNTKTPNKFVLTNMLSNIFNIFNNKFKNE